jgi:arylsulfatase A-like enzyme
MTRRNIDVGRTFATWVDDGIGVILDTLAERGLAEDTLVIFTSDHGNKGKYTCYDAAARQPCIVRWPGVVEAGTRDDRLVSNVDLAPTIMAAAGITPPREYTMDGTSFLPLLTGDGAYQRSDLFLEIARERAIVTEDGFKYIAVRHPPDIAAEIEAGASYAHSGRPLDGSQDIRYAVDEDYPAYFDADQLYDLDADPEEQENLADDPAYESRLSELQTRLEAYSQSLPHSFGEFA